MIYAFHYFTIVVTDTAISVVHPNLQDGSVIEPVLRTESKSSITVSKKKKRKSNLRPMILPFILNENRLLTRG